MEDLSCVYWFGALRIAGRAIDGLSEYNLKLVRDPVRQSQCSDPESDYCCTGIISSPNDEMDGFGKNCEKSSEYAKHRKGKARKIQRGHERGKKKSVPQDGGTSSHRSPPSQEKHRVVRPKGIKIPETPGRYIPFVQYLACAS